MHRLREFALQPWSYIAILIIGLAFKFYHIDMFGNEIGDLLTMIYRDNPIRGVNTNELRVNSFSTSDSGGALRLH